jgi:hypothetical protein
MPNFDGDTLTITLDSAKTDLSVQDDLYSGWKNWQLDDTKDVNNRKYPPAFRVVGGDDLTPGIKAGASYFIRNDLGWRIRPPEEDITIYAVGNLAPEDATLPILVPTLGDFSVLVAGLQPITQSVDKILLQQQVAFYDGKVYIDFPRGSSGDIYPIGLASSPVNNSFDADFISNRYNLFEFTIKDGTFVIPHDMLSYKFNGEGVFASVNINGYDLSGSIFNGITLNGTDFTNTPYSVTVTNGSTLINVMNLSGTISDSHLSGTTTLQSNSTTRFTDCDSDVSGTNTPEIDGQNGENLSLQFRDWHGGIKLINWSHSGNTASFDLSSAHLILDETVTEGVIVIRGIGHITDNTLPTSNVIIVKKGFTQGEYLTDVYKHFGLDKKDPQTITEISETQVEMENDEFKVKITQSGNVRTVEREDI